MAVVSSVIVERSNAVERVYSKILPELASSADDDASLKLKNIFVPSGLIVYHLNNVCSQLLYRQQ